ncbi:hypothetical protein RB200_33785 [Streptomyces sp. PmtG]
MQQEDEGVGDGGVQLRQGGQAGVRELVAAEAADDPDPLRRRGVRGLVADQAQRRRRGADSGERQLLGEAEPLADQMGVGVVQARDDPAAAQVDQPGAVPGQAQQLRERRVTPVAVPSGALSTPDGLVLRGHTLYAVQNLPGSVAALSLSGDFGAARPRADTAHASFAFPTGAALYEHRLLVVNSQFNTLGSPAAVSGTTPPKLPFWVSELPVPTR